MDAREKFREEYFRAVLDGNVGTQTAQGTPIKNNQFIYICQQIAKFTSNWSWGSKEIVMAVFQYCKYNEKGLLDLVSNGPFVARISGALGELEQKVEERVVKAQPKDDRILDPNDDPLYG